MFQRGFSREYVTSRGNDRKKLLVACLLCASVIGLAFGQAKAASKIPVIVASSVDTSPQNYSNVFYNKFTELAQQ